MLLENIVEKQKQLAKMAEKYFEQATSMPPEREYRLHYDPLHRFVLCLKSIEALLRVEIHLTGKDDVQEVPTEEIIRTMKKAGEELKTEKEEEDKIEKVKTDAGASKKRPISGAGPAAVGGGEKRK